MKKTVYTLSVNDYAPAIIRLTFPLMKRWANKIGAGFHVISERKFLNMPPVYEKFQMKELSERHGNDWNLFFDADTLIHPDFWDVTAVVGKEMTVSHGSDFIPVRFKPDKYFMRDGRWIGKGNWCLIVSDWCTDIWDTTKPVKVVDSKIFPTVAEGATIIKAEHLIDDYIISRNISRYGLKHVLIPELSEKYKMRQGLLWHQYLINSEQKEFYMKKQLMVWAAEGLANEGARNLKAGRALGILNQLEWEGHKLLNWEDFLPTIPCGQKIAEIIQSWDIEIKIKNINEIDAEMKRQVMLGALNQFQEDQNKIAAINAISQWKGSPGWADLLSVIPHGVQIAQYLNDLGAEIKLVSVNQLKGQA